MAFLDYSKGKVLQFHGKKRMTQALLYLQA